VNGISLFSGGGIGELAFKNIIPNYRTVGYVEWDKYCQEIIRARIRDGILDDAPIFGDIRQFNERFASKYAGRVHFISAGFPCQPFSVAGKNKGKEDERNMWPATIKCISIIRPEYAFLENVPNLLTHKYIRRIFGDLAEIGYDCEWDVVSAAFIGAPHIRKRVWILAHAVNLWQLQSQRTVENERERSGDGRQDVADTKRKGLHKGCQRKERQATRCGKQQQTNWSTEPDVGRVAHGVAHRVDRLKCLGNGWVPQVVKRILEVTDL